MPAGGLILVAMRLSQELAKAIVAHCLDEAPIEACGVLCGPGGQPASAIPMENELDSETAYAFEPTQQLAVWNDIYDRGEELAGIWHSHTRHAAYPSPRDVEYWVYKDVLCLIISTRNPEAPEIRAFRIEDGVVVEEPVEITSPAAGR